MSVSLQVQGLRKSFGDVHAVDDVSFELAPGELLAMIGPNGAGKSTTFNVIHGQLAPDAGSVLFEGESLLGCTPRQIWQRGIARTFQIAETFASLTVIELAQATTIYAHATGDNIDRVPYSDNEVSQTACLV